MDCSAEYSLACLILEKKKAVLAALLLEEEEDAERKRKQRLQIPRSVWNISTEDDATDADFEAFVRATMQFNRDEFTNVVSYVDDIPLSLKHHGIHAISCTKNVRSIIGLSLEEFGDVFLLVVEELHELFPNHPVCLKEGESHRFCELRMMLFMTLFRLRMACSFTSMEAIFGWSDSVIHEWYDTIITVLHCKLRCCGLVQSLGGGWQYHEACAWKMGHTVKEDYDLFLDRIEAMEDGINTTMKRSFVGSIGAVDGTYSLWPRYMLQRIYEN
jgi:hypothetical protein